MQILGFVGAMLAIASVACGQAQGLVFEEFDSVENWNGFELSESNVKSGGTCALWQEMVERPRVTCSEIPHDWSDYSAFTFWVYNERELPTGFMCIVSSENAESAGPDYWGIPVRLNFTGWKQFGVLLRPGSGVRSPRGWDQIDSITFTASGWENKPHPDAVVHIDRLELRTDIGGDEGPLLSDGEFYGLLRDDVAGLEATRLAAAAGDYGTAAVELLEYMRTREEPRWTFDWRDRESSLVEGHNTASADAVMEHSFNFQGRAAELPDDIDWNFNAYAPSEPAYTPEWTYQLNRFGFWVTLGRAYWATGDEKYAEEFVAQMTDWIVNEPAPVLGSPNTAPTWRTIEQGIRAAGSWMNAYYYFLGSPSMTPEAHELFLKSFVEHGRTLTRMTVEHPEHGGNWVTMECNGLAHIGVMFPEFEEAERWREVAYGRLLEELDRQVYPDGAQKELTTGYHQVARGSFVRALQPAELNGVEVPEEYLERLKRMYWYNLRAMMPNRTLPPLNDAWTTNVLSSFQEAYRIWGDEEFAWAAGEGGGAVEFGSWFFPYAGQAAMRSGWDSDARYMMFEVGPFGTGHQHEDKLGLYLHGYGRPLLTEAGTYSYDRSKWRRYVLSTPSHNTMMVDGLGQHRRGLRETYEADTPLEGCWASSELLDWATGTYADGYGPQVDGTGAALGREHDIDDVRHERTVVYVKPMPEGAQDYFVVIDRMLGEGAGSHEYSNLFHFDADEARVGDDGLTVTSVANAPGRVTLVPLETDGLSLRVVKGQEDPVQGWVPKAGHRAIPTAIYEKTGAAPTLFVTVVVPHAQSACPAIAARILQQGEAHIAIEVETEGGTDTILYAYEAALAMATGNVEADARLAMVREGTAGGVVAGIVGGTQVRVSGEAVEAAGAE